MNRIHFSILIVLVAAAAVSGQDPTTENPPTTTANPGAGYGAACNGLFLRCNRYSETVACVQRRHANETTTQAPTSNPLISVFNPRADIAEDVCETGLGVDLGRCQCKRNCKNGIYVEDAEFDPAREICVGLVGSACSLAVPNCTPHAHCVLLTSKCDCDKGYANNGSNRCVKNA